LSFGNPGTKIFRYSINPEVVRSRSNPHQDYPSGGTHLIPGLPKLNATTPCGLPAGGPGPGLELANTFGVKIYV